MTRRYGSNVRVELTRPFNVLYSVRIRARVSE
jgi:hypothetical protein